LVCCRRSKANQYNHTSLIRIDGVNSKEETEFYLGKRCVNCWPGQAGQAKASAACCRAE
jgi:ribosomal protein L35AE/L33A